ncbi:hypothetical protein ACNR9Q_07605 [Maribacter sp. X9]|uniref:hypothetical protein n=1 Tax=Maribacter sp. X9 TaxID=3402159 RepID=UPI003AF3FE4A
MKLIFTVLFVTLTAIGNLLVQETEKTNGTYVGHEDGIYVFMDGDGYKSEFSHVTEEVMKQFDLNSQDYIGKQFIITFTVDTELDENEEEIEVSTIVGLLMPQ